ncbi:MAG TPA: HRDC domain-containing protein, partial [Gemmatimonadaceae bacterium]|nr:HRDC domain-containing protein [Gemmatimonadaceae bacterium]
DRMEAIVRRAPQSVEDLADMKELRRWQIEVLGEEFVKALRKPAAAAKPAAVADDSPYKD